MPPLPCYAGSWRLQNALCWLREEKTCVAEAAAAEEVGGMQLRPEAAQIRGYSEKK